ncbi:Putative uncharacterized protein [Taphrina deformans PYCC 5710]|uniref:Uncharacterized protein n=1 Tax=Taphrina deformans (strain PYCC 5710 / ATCC 11124 / CBS 356.35 / IMI 108563 / JCM 9778 / NBRC 8474) TaxID=1097556 RepID=R4X746_TAPDE|nr:Putative uncharacterized protein [Taphrina deformans PYCC 5710]|eukprot:CCG81076.1 Putative uncharacterized protein [Taphrina deformans PYCC 5710]
MSARHSWISKREAWPEWSSFLERFDGPKPALELKSGDTVKVALSGLGTIQPTIVTNTGDQFSWLGTLGVRGIFDGQHEFHFVAGTNSTTHFVHREIFNGLLVTPMLGWAGMHAGIQANFEKFNASLKAKVEGRQ